MHRKSAVTGLLATLALALSIEASAIEVNQGTFDVTTQCEAYQSFKKEANPDSLQVQPGESFRIIEVNKEQYDWVRLQVSPERNGLRWVSAACGSVKDLALAHPGQPQSQSLCRIADTYDSYVLALTWQPGFCRHNPNGSKKPECQAMLNGQLAISHFTLHGLWPNKAQCGESYSNCNGAKLDLSSSTVDYIKPWMPNFYYGTQFGDYEWKKHGVCQTAMSDDDYFRLAIDLTRSFNDSAAGRYIREHIGGAISKDAFYSTLSQEFGSTHAANNFRLICRSGFLQEVRIALPQDLKGPRTVREIIGGNFVAQRAEDPKECRSDEIRIESSGR